MIERHPSEFWVTSLTEVPSGLVSLARYAADVFPSPQAPQPPSRTHVHIARNVSERFREALFISADAVFDEERKDADDEKWHHRDKELNEFYRQLLGSGEGNEVLQVGYMTREKVLGPLQQEERLQQVRRHKTKL
ncbi:hypothetical protein EUX98_g1960 [Antrodiella citrinella]|uniref:Uncharacterized protein n=1 Tax=Antrodiella citrinella TaxID=2447956 RepID=A0A4S4N363_9APHY|nr:hypothetical protein EUX98_g1960 [Antrodiella citrinella]